MIIYDPKIAILLIAFNRSNIKQVFDRIKVVKPRRLYIAVDESTNDTQCKICKETTSIVSHIVFITIEQPKLIRNIRV